MSDARVRILSREIIPGSLSIFPVEGKGNAAYGARMMYRVCEEVGTGKTKILREREESGPPLWCDFKDNPEFWVKMNVMFKMALIPLKEIEDEYRAMFKKLKG